MGSNKRTISIFLTVLFMLFIFAGLPATSLSAEKVAGKQEIKQQNNPYAKAEITIKIIPSVNKTFGYDIFINGQPAIASAPYTGIAGE